MFFLIIIHKANIMRGSECKFQRRFHNIIDWFGSLDDPLIFVEGIRSEWMSSWTHSDFRGEQLSGKDIERMILHISTWMLACADIEVLEGLASFLLELMPHMTRHISNRMTCNCKRNLRRHMTSNVYESTNGNTSDV